MAGDLSTIGGPHGPFSAQFLASYELVRLLGEGAMGSVWLMRDRGLDRPVAVKVVKAGAVTPKAQARLLNEAKVLARVSSPHIVAVHGAGYDGEMPYIICEFVEGESLHARLVRPPRLSVSLACRIGMNILEGLAAAHAKGVIHRDLKPANVFLTAGNKPKIGDFGLAKAQDVTSGTVAGRILGTPPYMSPEQCRGGSTTVESDLYAVGLMLFEMVCGRRVFFGPGLLDYLNQHASEPAPRARSVRADLPEALDDLIARALEKDPARRFGSATEMRRALKEIYRGFGREVKTPGVPVYDDTPPTVRGGEVPGGDVVAGRLLAGRYELVRRLGQGGMGQVWLARDTALDGAEVAVKLLPPELWRDADAKVAVKHEAKLSQKLAHPNVVRLVNLEPGDVPFLVMEFVDGPTLAELLAQRREDEAGPLRAAEASELLGDLAAALDHAHELGVIHRDLKPSNVLLAARGDGWRAKLADFGIAAELQTFRTRTTGVMPVGTLAYMSPEQVACQRPAPAQDVYALGATLYQMLALTPPFAGGDLAYAIVHEPPPPLEGVPDAVAAVVMRALAKRPEERPASAGALAAELKAAVAAGAAPVAPVVPIAVAPTPPAPRAEPPRTDPPLRVIDRRSDTPRPDTRPDENAPRDRAGDVKPDVEPPPTVREPAPEPPPAPVAPERAAEPRADAVPEAAGGEAARPRRSVFPLFFAVVGLLCGDWAGDRYLDAAARAARRVYTSAELEELNALESLYLTTKSAVEESKSYLDELRRTGIPQRRTPPAPSLGGGPASAEQLALNRVEERFTSGYRSLPVVYGARMHTAHLVRQQRGALALLILVPLTLVLVALGRPGFASSACALLMGTAIGAASAFGTGGSLPGLEPSPGFQEKIDGVRARLWPLLEELREAKLVRSAMEHTLGTDAANRRDTSRD